jgi:hypothetical protein
MNSKLVEAIYQLRPVEFDFTIENFEGKHSIGLIAEEVIEYIPEIVIHNELEPEKIEGVDYEKLVAPLIKIVQEHRKHINTLQEYRNTLETIIQDYQVRITNLENKNT